MPDSDAHEATETTPHVGDPPTRIPTATDTVMRHEGWARAVAACIALVLAGLTIPGADDFALDDAWIHLAYAKSVRLGDGLSYNPGDWETGFSSPLYAAVLAVWPIAGNPVVPVKLLGALLHAVAAWFAAHVGLTLVRRQASLSQPLPVLSVALLAGVLCASAPALVHGATSGMEVSLASATVLACCAATIAGAPGAAAITGALATWARPESAGFVLALGGLLAAARFRARKSAPQPWRAAVAAMLGAVGAVALWVGWCLVVSGYPWPNAQRIKGAGGGIAGLGYLSAEVLVWQPWVISMTGVAVAAWAILRDVRARRWELSALLLATLATWIAIAVTRPLHPGTGFYESRYFAPYVGPIAVVLPFGLLGIRRWLAAVLITPVLVLTGMQLADVRTRLLEQSQDTRTVHTAVGRRVAELLPRDAVIAVEGAGAIRFFAPRTMTVLDIVGLNDHRAAALHHDRRAKMCHFVRQRPTHFAIPADWLGLFTPVFAMHPVATFEDPVYTQVQPPRPLTVVLAAVDAIHPAWQQRCSAGQPAFAPRGKSQ